MFRGDVSHVADEDISKATLTYVEKDDPEMMAAWQTARDSVNEFVQKMDDPQFSDSDFYVKKRFDQGDRSEHIWISGLRVDGSEFIGAVGNDPQIVNNIQCGDEARVAFDEISDWMITKGDEMIGGFTVAILMQRRG